MTTNEKKQLKIKINVIWDNHYRYGEIIAEAFYKYFCSGELSILPSNVLSIPVRCKPIENFSKPIKCIQGYLTVNVLLADDNMRVNDVNRLLATQLENKKNKNHLYIPVAMSKNGCKYIDKSECITAYDCEQDYIRKDSRTTEINYIREKLSEENKDHLLLILRRTLESIAGYYFFLVGRSNTKNIGLFICHTKSTGKKELSLIQSYLASNTTSSFFVDKNSILLGERLDKRIFTDICKRAVIVIATDDISGREWCLKEIAKAKEYNLPIIIIDAYSLGDNRLFPYLGNCPVIRLESRVDANTNAEIIYESLANEILWNTYNIYKRSYAKSVKVLPRKIELMDIAFLKKRYNRIVYPEPPLADTEKTIINGIISQLNRKVIYETEISARTEKYKNLKPKVMISSSANAEYQRTDGANCCVGINYAVREITRYLIYMGCTILNAGNYETDGFNRVILKQLINYATLSKSSFAKCIHYVNPYIKINDSDKFVNFQGEFIDELIEFKMVDVPNENCGKPMVYVRDAITTDTEIIMVIGGMTDDGNRTGIDYEVELGIEKGKSIYLLGGFGFKAKELCDKYLTEGNYEKLNSGLSLSEYKKLANMYEIGEILELIFKGWKKINSIKN